MVLRGLPYKRKGYERQRFFVSGAAGYSWAQEAGAKMLVIVHNARIGGHGLAERAIADIASVYDGDIIFGKELMAVPL